MCVCASMELTGSVEKGFVQIATCVGVSLCYHYAVPSAQLLAHHSLIMIGVSSILHRPAFNAHLPAQIDELPH